MAMAETSSRAAWTTVGVLTLAYVFSYLDRQILVLLVGPVRADLHISDTAFSLLAGAAFALFYAVMALPLAIIADRGSRRRLIMAGVAVWGSMTILCGLSTSFAMLFFARMGVGIGEAALTPTAYSLIADLFAPEKRGRAMGVFTTATFLGGGLSLLGGGAVVTLVSGMPPGAAPFGLHPWQIAFVAVGALTLLLLLPLRAIADPPRHQAADTSGLGAAAAHIWRERAAYAPMFLGIPFASMIVYGVQAWLPTLFIRGYGWSAGEAGAMLGVVTLVAGIGGGIASGALADRWRARGKGDAALRLNAMLVLVAVPLPALIAFAPGPKAALVMAGLFVLVSSLTVPLAPTALQAITPPPLRAQVSALFLLAVNLVGIGVGPTAVALASDLVFAGDKAIGSALALVGTLSYLASALLLWRGLGAYGRAVMALEGESHVIRI